MSDPFPPITDPRFGAALSDEAFELHAAQHVASLAPNAAAVRPDNTMPDNLRKRKTIAAYVDAIQGAAAGPTGGVRELTADWELGGGLAHGVEFNDMTTVTLDAQSLNLSGVGNVAIASTGAGVGQGELEIRADQTLKVVSPDVFDQSAIAGATLTLLDPVEGTSEFVSAHYATVAALKAAPTLVDGGLYSTAGYHSAGDGGHGTYRYVAASSATSDGGLVHAHNTLPGRLQLINNGVVNVKQFGAKGDGTTDDTAQVQAAINTGSPVQFPAGSFSVGPLTQATNFQRFTAVGQVSLVKRSNGVLMNSTGNYVEFNGLQFVGTGFTGDNIVSSGGHPRFLNCSSYGTPGRALKATGAHVQIIGTSGSYSTTDATASGFDIEIGVSGTATLYHELIGVYTSQATGGVLMTDVGSHTILGGQIGKLSILSGTSPAGVNGGKISACRIIGDVVVDLSNAQFSAVQFATQTITFGASTSGCTLDASNNTRSATVINSGNANTVIVRATSAGSYTELSYGPSAWTMNAWRITSGVGFESTGNIAIANNTAFRCRTSTAALANAATLNASDNWTIGSAATAAGNTSIVSGSGGVYFTVDGASRFQATASAFRPVADATYHLGAAAQRFNTLYASNGTINTSDAREKEDIAEIGDVEVRVARRIKGLFRTFKFKSAVKKKGDGARIHVGVIAQDVRDAFLAEGLDPTRYGMFCYDEWGPETQEDGSVRDGGNLYGIRYDELLAFVMLA